MMVKIASTRGPFYHISLTTLPTISVLCSTLGTMVAPVLATQKILQRGDVKM
eukprot:TRINITY_DN4682_c0_g1_i1.p4 TRINITY_DN4682_c0_g1~~TRINITY_DN4682_c0_g1_i1.p4  ORF type:complete len:52 (-),score=5.46 TRINITY_DN4682_c0_g1_i1:272-427(-)